MLLFTYTDVGFFQTPQHETKMKKMNIFSSGSVSMDVNLEKTGFIQGEISPSDVVSHTKDGFDMSWSGFQEKE